MPRVCSRRRFVATVGGFAGVATVGMARHLLATERTKYGPFEMGLQTYSLRKFSTEKALQTMHDLGISTVEFFDVHYLNSSNGEQISAMNQKLAGHQLKVLSHGVHAFSKDHQANKRLFDFAKRAGIRNLTADPTEDAFDSLDKLVAEYDIRIAIHNHGPGSRYDKVDSVLNAIKNRHPNVGACADLGHFIRSAEDPVRVINLLKGRLFGVHLKDFDAPRRDANGCVLGKGLLDVTAVFKALKKVNLPTDACLALEYEENANDPVDDLKQCLVAAQESARQAFS
jgi:sugar phosphate isomerase/epimerase